MSNPLPVKFAIVVSVALGSIGLAALVGVWTALQSATGLAVSVPVVALALIAALIFAGEDTKSKLLNWARQRIEERGWRSAPAQMASLGFAFFALMSVCLTHEGLMQGERMFLGPMISRLDRDVDRATEALASRTSEADRAERQYTRRIERIEREIEDQPNDWRGDRQREALRDRIDTIEREQSAALLPYEARTAATSTALASARGARRSAPQGFSALTVTFPFVGRIAFIPWLIAIGIEFLTGFVAWIAAPRAPQKREVYLTDIIGMQQDGLELMTDRDEVQKIGRGARGIATKADHVLAGRAGILVASERERSVSGS